MSLQTHTNRELGSMDGSGLPSVWLHKQIQKRTTVHECREEKKREIPYSVSDRRLGRQRDGVKQKGKRRNAREKKKRRGQTL